MKDMICCSPSHSVRYSASGLLRIRRSTYSSISHVAISSAHQFCHLSPTVPCHQLSGPSVDMALVEVLNRAASIAIPS